MSKTLQMDIESMAVWPSAFHAAHGSAPLVKLPDAPDRERCGVGGVRRPLLRYFGGKWQLRNWIIAHLPPHQFYAEPFAGAASVLLAKAPAPAGEIINDLNGDVINLFRVMQSAEQSEELFRRLEWTPYAQAELRAAADATDDPVERARRMVVRSFMGIEGSGMVGSISGFRMGNVDLSRVDQVGKRTFRNCAIDWMNWKEALGAIRERLARVMIYERDALDFIRLMDSPDCLLYVDPPYHHGARAEARYAVEFVAHAELVAALLVTKAKVVLSGYDCPEYQPLADAGWTRIEREYRANMSLRRRVEVLWKNRSDSELFAGGGGGFENPSPAQKEQNAKMSH